MAAAATPFLIFFIILLTDIRKSKYPVKSARWLKSAAAVILFVMATTGLRPLLNLYILSKQLPYRAVSPRGTIAFRYSVRADNLLRTLNYIENNSRPDDYIFVTSWSAPPLYALANRRNPTYYDSLIDLFLRDSSVDQQQIIRDIVTKKTKLIIHDPEWGYDENPERRFQASCKLLDDFITGRCVKLEQIGKLSIYTLKQECSL